MFLHCRSCILLSAAHGDLKSLKEAVIKMAKQCKEALTKFTLAFLNRES